MRLLCLLFMFFLFDVNVSKALRRKERSALISNELVDEVNKPWKYLLRRINDGRIKNIRRGQTKDERGRHGWLSLMKQIQHEDDQTRRLGQKPFRNRRRYTDESGRDSSTSMEMIRWKEQFDEDWNREKTKALAVKKKVPMSAVVNMAAARPWSIPCGDPTEHDQPWGTCTLSFQCMPALRVYRGDFQCGHTHFICCAALATHYDMYQGLDMSFVDTGSSSTGEREKYDVKSARVRYKKRRREKIRRWKNRFRSKKRLKRMIKRLTHEIRKNLHRAFRNTSMDRKYKVKNMKKTIKLLKNRFREERLKLKQKMHADIEKADHDLKVRLTNVNNLNSQYLTNATFRELLNKFNLTIKDIKTLRTIPSELKPYLIPTKNNSVEDVAVDRVDAADARKFEEEVTETEDVIEETTPSANLTKFSNDSSIEADLYSGLDGKLSEVEQVEIDEITPVPPDYNMVKEPVASPIETRRFGSNFRSQRKHGKKLKGKGTDYDIEFGKLYY